jgi:multiple sugar transport system permease protein
VTTRAGVAPEEQLAAAGEPAAEESRWSGRHDWTSRLPFSPWHLVLVPIAFILLVPLIWMLITSLLTQSEANRFPPVLIPHHPRFQNYPDAFRAAPFGHFFANSAIVTLVVVASNLVVCSLAGYAFARLRFLGRKALFVTLMATLMVPFQVTMIPVFLIVKWFGDNVWSYLGIDHLGALMLPNLATAFGIFFLRQFFQTVPVELEEAARVDGTSRLGVLFKIVLPLSLPALSTLAALTFLESWNNFLWPLIVVTSEKQMTVPLGLSYFQGNHTTQWPLLMAGNVMSLLPMLAVFVLAQRYFVQSVAGTGLKG